MKEYTIPIDCPEWCDPVRFGRAWSGEKFVGSAGDVQEWRPAMPSINSFLIVRKSFVWPLWLSAAAIAKDDDGRVFIFTRCVPSVETFAPAGWISEDSPILWDHITKDDHGLGDVQWEESLRINPDFTEE